MWGMQVKLHAFLTSAVDGGKWPTNPQVALHPDGHWIHTLAGPVAGLDVVGKRKVPVPVPVRN
jgi:hypothetical protein